MSIVGKTIGGYRILERNPPLDDVGLFLRTLEWLRRRREPVGEIDTDELVAAAG